MKAIHLKLSDNIPTICVLGHLFLFFLIEVEWKFVYELFCQLGKIFYQKNDNDSTRKSAPWKIVPRKIVPNPNPKTPCNPNPGGIFWGQSSEGQFSDH